MNLSTFLSELQKAAEKMPAGRIWNKLRLDSGAQPYVYRWSDLDGEEREMAWRTLHCPITAVAQSMGYGEYHPNEAMRIGVELLPLSDEDASRIVKAADLGDPTAAVSDIVSLREAMNRACGL